MQIELSESVYVAGEKHKSTVILPLFSLENEIIRKRKISEEITVLEDSWYGVKLTGIKDEKIDELLLYLT